ncbi:MAG: SAM-dependent methyltransferase [Betaproteobacteria bacterium]|nr:SAM-dependent methyltransferase [Betaproteobacteria bacterium]
MKKLIPPILPDSVAPNDIQLAHSKKLLNTIIDRIHEQGGWIDFATFMNMVLYEPGLGYYVAGSAKLGSHGDFVTAPQLGNLFAKTLAQAIVPVLNQLSTKESVVLELGAGSGQLAHDLLLALAERGQLPKRYIILDVSPELTSRQQTLLSRLPQHISTQIEWASCWPTQFDGVLIANEVLDAFAVHRIERRSEGWFEWGVSVHENELREESRVLTNHALMECLPPINNEYLPYMTEVNLSAMALMKTVAESLREGRAYFIDYGFPEREFYHPQRAEGTLMCHYRHYAHPNPMCLFGLQDITSHIDFTSVARAARQEGLVIKDYATQAQFLLHHGLINCLTAPVTDMNVDMVRQSQEVNMLMSPAEMGELFKVLVLGRGEEEESALVQLGLS